MKSSIRLKTVAFTAFAALGSAFADNVHYWNRSGEEHSVADLNYWTEWQDGNTYFGSDWLFLKGTATLSEGMTFSCPSNFRMGLSGYWWGNTSPVLKITGGEFSVAGEITIGRDSGSSGTVEMSGGTIALQIENKMTVGSNGAGTIEQSGGEVRFYGGNRTDTSKVPAIGANNGAVGVYNLSGGMLTREHMTFYGNWNGAESVFAVGNNGAGTLNISATGFLDCADRLLLADGESSSGELNLNGGTACIMGIKGGSGTSRIVFNGGVLSPTVANATWFQNIGSLLVNEGGAVISNDFDVTIDHVLASGATHDGGLVKKGASTLTLSAANTFNGPVVIEKGTLKLGCDNAIPAGATVTVKSGATLDLNGKAFTGTIIDESTGTAKAYGAVGLPGVEVLGERLLKNAVGWYDASDTSTLTTDGDTDHVTAWVNKAAGGSAYNLVYQGGQTPSSRAESSLNGKTTMSIANTSGYQAKETLSGWTATTPRTMLIVSRRDSGKAFYGMCINDSGTAGAFAIERNDYGTRSGTWDSAYDGSGKYRTVGSIALDEDIWETQVLWGDCQDGKCTVGGYKYNSSSKQTANIEVMSLSGNFGSGDRSKIKLNIGIDYGSHGYGNIAEAAVFDVKLSSDELAEVNAYLNRKWYGENGCRYVGSIASLELTDGSSLDIADTVATIGTLSGMGAVDGSNAMLTVSTFAPVCGDIIVDAPVAEPAEGEYVTLRITINPANGGCGTLVVPAGYDLSKVDLVVTGCEHLTSADTFTVFQGKAGETLSKFHSVASDSERGLKLVYDNSTGTVTGSLPKGFMLIIR